jgi:hypothetical protein
MCPDMYRALNKLPRAEITDLGQLLLAFAGLFLLTTVNDVHRGGLPFGPMTLASRNIPDASTNTREVTGNTEVKRGFRLEVHSSRHSRTKGSLLRAESDSLVKAITAELNDTISLPFDIEVSLENCGDADVFYDDESHNVVMCYEWISTMERIISRQLPGKVKARETLKTLVAGVILHESAHALIHILNLPVTGREEDDADQFSTLVLLHERDGARKAMEIALIHKVMSQMYEGEPTAYWDEHSPDGQRYYDTLCMIYGRDPEGNRKLVSSNALPIDRANICEQDYRRIESAWKTLLKPYAKDSLRANG